MTRDTNDLFEYEVAVSFAEEDRAVAEEFADLLSSKKIKVLLDEYKASEAPLWGKDPLDHLVNIYARKARYCVLFISQHYPLKRWTEEERTSAQERAFRDANQYILPIRLDDAEVQGMNETPAYRDLRQDSMESLVNWLEGKLAEARNQPGPPPQSHDLRSGNVPNTHRKPDD